jgi:transcription antitermination factor NusG
MEAVMNRPESLAWFAVITRWGQWKKIPKRLQELGVGCFIPPSYNTLVFIHAEKSRALNLVNAGEIKGRFLIDRQTHSLLEIPDSQMESFIRVTTECPYATTSTDVPITKGTRVKVIRGPLKDVEGEVMEHPSGVQLLVRVQTLICARVNIAREDVIPLPEN